MVLGAVVGTTGILAGNSVIATVSSTGLAVTGTLSATGVVSVTGGSTVYGTAAQFGVADGQSGSTDSRFLFRPNSSTTIAGLRIVCNSATIVDLEAGIFTSGGNMTTVQTLRLSGNGGLTTIGGALSATGVATFSAGTAALPAITTTGDTNTGIWFPAADTIAFTEGGAESMRIDSSGGVLINTTSSTASIGQTAKLQVAGGIRTTTGFTSSISLGTIVQNTTTTAAVGFNGLWLIGNGGNTTALILITLSGGSTGTQLVFSTASDIVCGTTSEPSGGTYLRLWISGGVLQVKNVNAYTGPWFMTPLATFSN